MVSSATLIVISLFIMILVSFWGSFRWSQLNVADVYVLMFGVFWRIRFFGWLGFESIQI